MAPISLVLVAGLLALSGVDCRKDKVRISQWVNAKCEGHTAPEKQLEPKDGQCVNMDTASIRFHAPLKSKYAGWIHEADHGIQCGAIVYDKPNCPSVDNNKAFHKTDINLPAALENDCVALPSTIKSVKFMCGNVFPPPDAYSRVRVHTATSWHLDDSNRPVPSVYRVMESVTGLTVAATSAVQAISPRNEPALEAASESSQDDTEEEREIAETKHHRKLMWLNHPFAASLLCFECWTKHEKKFKKFKCESGMDTAMDCGPNPMETFCHTVAFITTTVFVAAPTHTHSLEERGKSMKVKLNHPFDTKAGEVCAKAKWKHEGKLKQRIVIDGPHGCPKNGAMIIDPEFPESTHKVAIATCTKTVSIITITATKTTTVTGSVHKHTSTVTEQETECGHEL